MQVWVMCPPTMFRKKLPALAGGNMDVAEGGAGVRWASVPSWKHYDKVNTSFVESLIWKYPYIYKKKWNNMIYELEAEGKGTKASEGKCGNVKRGVVVTGLFLWSIHSKTCSDILHKAVSYRY